MNVLYPDYDNSLISLMNSIRDFFDCEVFHPTLKEADELLTEEIKNVVVILFDGMGSKILDKHLSKDSFLQSHKIRDILSTCPSTTTAATTSVRTGKTPIENGWLGWHQYLSEINDDIILFKNKQYYGDKTYQKGIAEQIIPFKTIAEDINEKGYNAIEIWPSFSDVNKCSSLKSFFRKIENFINTSDEKKFIYAYWDDPDHLLHKVGTDSKKVTKNIKTIESFCKSLYKRIDKNTIVFVIADHGHINCNIKYLEDYEDFLETFERLPTIEPRNAAFYIKEGFESEFINKFKQYFENDFILLKTSEAIKNNLYGIGKSHSKSIEMLGDYVAIATNNVQFQYKRNTSDNNISMHAGLTEDEMLVPLIVFKK